MKARYFHSKPHFSAWSKLFVLSEDGILHSEYLQFMQPSMSNSKVNFENFTKEDIPLGGNVNELSYQEIIEVNLTRFPNWIAKYEKELKSFKISTFYI